MTKRLTFPAPKRCTLACGTRSLPKGKSEAAWHDVPWTLEEVERAKLAGAYFARGRHDFADDEAEAAALGRKVKRGGSIRQLLSRLSPAQLEILRNELSKEVGL